jgi:GPI mannosyltransferase 1 subunit M
MKAIWQVISISALVHLILIVYSLWHDKNFQFKYTDLDYWVFGDAARAVMSGFPPFARTTYRYTPLLAYLLIPGRWLGIEEAFGKILFSAVDLIVGFLIYRLLRLRGWHSVDASRHSALFWLLNPMALAISTRGNAESLICACVLGVIYFLMVRKRVLAALLFGFSVHFKIFPIIYAPSILIFLGIYHKLASSSTAKNYSTASIYESLNTSTSTLSPSSAGVRLSSSPLIRSASPNRLAESMSGAGGLSGIVNQRRAYHASVSRSALSKQDLLEDSAKLLPVIKNSNGAKVTIFPPSKVLLSLFSGRITIKSSHLAFTAISASVFLGLTAIFYYIYGNAFVHEALIYHLIRKDHRHNFSPYFLQFYMESGSIILSKWIPIISFVPQALLMLLIAFKYARKDLPFACFLQTFVFVTFNKVVTSQVRYKSLLCTFINQFYQYFLWYLCFLPVITSSLRRMSGIKWFVVVFFWILGQVDY